MVMNSSRPYLIRAIYDWIVDNECTPHIAVDAFVEGVEVPQDYVRNGQIVLNIAPDAVSHFHLGDSEIAFSARFRGISMEVVVPYAAVLGIYAKENGQGMMFDPEEPAPQPPRGPRPVSGTGAKGKSGAGKPNLRVVK